MDKVLAIIKEKRSQNEFVAKIFDDFSNTTQYAINEATYKIKISNTISFENGDLLLIEVQNLKNDVIEGTAKKYNRTSTSEILIWKE
jgi:hypothetical protein